MNDQLICPNCKKPVPLTEAISHQLKEKLQKQRDEDRREVEEEKRRLRTQAQTWKEEQQKKLEEELTRQIEERTRKKLEREIELKLKDSQNEREELAKQNTSFKEQLLEMNKLVRQMKTQEEENRIAFEKKLHEEQDKILEDAKKKAEELNHMRMLEMEKKLRDALLVNDELKRKLEQGSQQTQGEVLELELEGILKREFPMDEVKPVPKGVQGADLIQIVKNNYGKSIGSIVWEFKRTKAWSNEWVTKLKDDQRQIKADVAVLITQTLPPTLKSFGLHEGIWVGDFISVIGLASVLRSGILKVAIIKSAVEGSNEKKDILWNYLTSAQFVNRLQAVADVYSSMREDLEKEKNFFKKKWAKEELSIQKVTDSIYEMHGELESIMGKELTGIKGVEMLPDGKIEESLLFDN